ncbi:MAG: VOC family protein [Alphaproteobacteria bacterium]|nr:VOC family protein [Alphaproteobacteria bacterium]
MEQRVSLITLGVSNLARATAFYEALGWKRGLLGAEGVSFFQTGGMILGLWPREELVKDARIGAAEAAAPPGVGVALAYNARSREEVDAVLAEAEAAGATLPRPAEDTSWSGYTGYFRDTEGFLWEIAWNPGFAIAEDGSVMLPDQGQNVPET